jgi:acetaldehyde dehydrogenase (acetylating)
MAMTVVPVRYRLRLKQRLAVVAYAEAHGILASIARRRANGGSAGAKLVNAGCSRGIRTVGGAGWTTA